MDEHEKKEGTLLQKLLPPENDLFIANDFSSENDPLQQIIAMASSMFQ